MSPITPRRQEVTITGINLPFRAMVFFITKAAIASIPATVIMAFVIVAAFGVGQATLSLNGLRSLGAPVRRIAEALRNKKPSVRVGHQELERQPSASPLTLSFRGGVPVDPMSIRAPYSEGTNDALYIVALYQCADSAKKRISIPKRASIQGLDSGQAFGPTSRSVSGAITWTEKRGQTRNVKFVCNVIQSTNGLKISNVHVSR